MKFPSKTVVTSNKLNLSLVSLEEWNIVTLKGTNITKYLHNHFTSDIENLNINQYSITTHCNTKGKTISNLYVFHYKKGIAYIIRKSVCYKQIKILKKYDIFSKIKINIENKLILLGLIGKKAKHILNKVFNITHDENHKVINNNNMTLLYYKYPITRYLIITTHKFAEIIKNKLNVFQIYLNNSIQWLALDIEAGYPIIDIINSEKFIPQAINIELLNGINFKKGCYIGQEIISKIKHCGKNKYFLHKLNIKNTSYFPTPGNIIEMKINNISTNKWIKIGIILAICKINNYDILLQVVINTKIFKKDIIRILKKNKNF